MTEEKEKTSIMDMIGYAISMIVVGFIIFILIWPLIDPTPDKSSSIEENIQSVKEK